MEQICKGLNESAQAIHKNNKEKGFWENGYNVGELLMLVTSELGEAMEAHRKGKFARLSNFDHEVSKEGSHPITTFQENIKDTFEDEVADAIIRLLDLSAGLGINIERHIQEKVKYNMSRPRLHGKEY